MKLTIGLLCALSFCGWKASAAETEMADYAAKELAFSIRYPKTWEKQENVAGAAVGFIAPKEGEAAVFRANANIIAHDLPKDTALQQFADAQQSGVEKMFKDYTAVESKEISIGVLKALKIVYAHTHNKIKLKVVTVLAVAGERGFIVTCSAEAKSFEKHKKEFDAIVESFKAL